MKFLISSTVESERSVQDDAEIILLKPKKWLMYLSQTGSHRLSLILVNTSKHSEYIVLEAGEENIPVLQIMEEKLREFLRGSGLFVKQCNFSFTTAETGFTLGIIIPCMQLTSSEFVGSFV